MRSSWSERFWAAVLVVGTVALIGMLGWLVYPYAVEYFTPPTPAPEQGRAVVREVPFSPEGEGECIDGPTQIGPPDYEPYAYSAMISLETMGLLPELIESVTLDWVWGSEDGLEYWAIVNRTVFEFAVECFINREGNFFIKFRTVEIRQLQEAQ